MNYKFWFAALFLWLIQPAFLDARQDTKKPVSHENKPNPLEQFQTRVTQAVEKAKPCFVFITGGSGVLISEDGYFLTNHHVGELLPLDTLVYLTSGKSVMAKRICIDPLGDLALYRCQEKMEYPFLPLGDSDALEVGQYAVAIGNPFNLAVPERGTKEMQPTFSLGIVSAMHRQHNAYADAIQTDAAINPGNSGGPLMTLDGTLIGINGRIATRFFNKVNSGVGYAIPSNQIKRFLPLMKKGGEDGYVYHGQIEGLRFSNRLMDGKGVLVQDAKEGSTAGQSGFKKLDLITHLDGLSVHNRSRFRGLLGTYPAGASVKITVERGQQSLTLTAKLDRIALPSDKGVPYTGLLVEEIDGLLYILDVQPDSPAEGAGLTAGDQIKKVDGRAFATPEQFIDHLKGKKGGNKIHLVVERAGAEMQFEVELKDKPE